MLYWILRGGGNISIIFSNHCNNLNISPLLCIASLQATAIAYYRQLYVGLAHVVWILNFSTYRCRILDNVIYSVAS